MLEEKDSSYEMESRYENFGAHENRNTDAAIGIDYEEQRVSRQLGSTDTH